ncbi:MAG: VWA domain-containing protein [Blautia sp.]|nr:VWA domain-containing protein [Blautia sp.]
MKKGLTEMVLILDRSGSMKALEEDTMGGFNSLVEKQKAEEGEAYCSVVLFDHERIVLYDRVDIEKVPPMTRKDYYARGMTALLDAVGFSIHHISNIHKYAREEDVPEKTVFVIITDGLENASKHYTYQKVKEMITEKQEKYGWEFIFLGANIDAVEEAGRIGIRPNQAARYEADKEGTRVGYAAASKVLCRARSRSRDHVVASLLEEEDLLAEVREDYAKRHKS